MRFANFTFETVVILSTHELTRDAKPVLHRRLDRQPQERGVNRVGREQADRDRSCCLESVVLENYGGPWLPRIIGSASDALDLAASH